MRWIPLVALVGSLLACQQPQPQPRPEIKPAYFNDSGAALGNLAKMVHRQLEGIKYPLAAIPVDDFFNESSAEVSTSGKAFQKQLAELLGRERNTLSFVSLDRKNIEGAQWIVLASYANMDDKEAEQPGKWIRLKVSVADVLSGQRLAAAESYLQAAAFQAEPTRFFKDAPLYLNDQRHRERVEVINGKTEPLKQKLAVQAVFAEAVGAYETGSYADAEAGFAEVIKTTPDHRGALTGMYQSLWQQGKKPGAETAFTNLLAQTADKGSLPIKILFRVNATDYVDIGDLPQQYRLWTKSVGQLLASKSRCLDVTGHASRSGAAEYNNRLSLQRANRIVSQIQQQTPAVNGKIKAFGKGFQETIVGNGANDASDAIDRRVEFAIKSCS